MSDTPKRDEWEARWKEYMEGTLWESRIVRSAREALAEADAMLMFRTEQRDDLLKMLEQAEAKAKTLLKLSNNDLRKLKQAEAANAELDKHWNSVVDKLAEADATIKRLNWMLNDFVTSSARNSGWYRPEEAMDKLPEQHLKEIGDRWMADLERRWEEHESNL